MSKNLSETSETLGAKTPRVEASITQKNRDKKNITMKKVLTLFAILASFSAFSQSMGISADGSIPNSSAMLDVKSTTKGFLTPRMTEAQMLAIQNPAQGLLVFCANCGTNGEYNVYKGYGWVVLGGATTVGPLGVATANGVTFSNGVLNLAPANASFPGIVTTGAQTIAGAKTFTGALTATNQKLSGTLVVGANTPDPSAKLDITSTTQGFLPPRMTEVEMMAIQDPAQGLIVFCTDCDLTGSGGAYQFYNGTTWTAMGSTNGGGTGTLPVPVNQGGTGAISPRLAFNNLSPMMDQGEMLYHDGNDVVKLRRGSPYNFLAMMPPSGDDLVKDPSIPIPKWFGITDLISFINELLPTIIQIASEIGGAELPRGTRRAITNFLVSKPLVQEISTRLNESNGYVSDTASKQYGIGTELNFPDSTIQLGNSRGVKYVKTYGTITAGTVTYPNAHNSTSGQVLTINNAGVATWQTAAAGGGGVPYTGATQAVNLGAYDLTVNGITVGKGGGNRSYNTASGQNALAANTTGSGNTASGGLTLSSNTTGSNNTVSGVNALGNNISGSNNTASGVNALSNNTIGSYNTAIGQGANVGSNNLTNATAIGYNASVTADSTIQLGNTSVKYIQTSGTVKAGTVTYPNAHNSTSGQVLTINNTGVATWAAAAGGGGVPYTGATQGVNLGAYDLTVNGITVGKGGGNIENNTASGKDALAANTTGYNNTAGGYFVLKSNTTGESNTASGFGALVSNTEGSGNTASGAEALANNITGNANTAIGGGTLISNTTGQGNTASGVGALSNNTTGSFNTAIGMTANVGYDTLSNATAIGYGAIVTGINSIQLGNTAVTDVITSGKFTAGAVTYPNAHNSTNGQVLTIDDAGVATWAAAAAAGIPYTGATQGVNLGAYDLTVNGITVGRGAGGKENNTASGKNTLAANTTGDGNTASGAGALSSNTTGSFNTAIGLMANVGYDTLTNATAIGYGAIVTGINSIQLGNTAVTDVITSGKFTAGAVTYPNAHNSINGQVLTIDDAGVATWGAASAGVPYTGADQGVDLGAYDLKVNGITVGTGGGNVNTNTANGLDALVSNTTGANNTASGFNALSSDTTGMNNTATGYFALGTNTRGSDNTASGASALVSNTTGGGNTASGVNALYANTTGSNNTAIGYGADVGTDNLTNTTAIGYQAVVNTDNTIQLGNTAVTNVNTSGTINAAGLRLGVNTPNASAALEVNSTTQGFLPPRMTTSQRDLIGSPAEGLTVWNSTNKQLEVYDGSYWVNMNGNLVATLNVGDSYGGGIVAYILTPTDPGYVAKETHGLIAATSDQSTGILWNNGTNTTTGATATTIGTGLANTITIITSQGETQTDYAAGLARAHNGGQYTDWYLPSSNELNKLYLNRVAIGGFTDTNPYWSSTENDQVYAYYLFFNNGILSNVPKTNTFRVRAVRSF